MQCSKCKKDIADYDLRWLTPYENLSEIICDPCDTELFLQDCLETHSFQIDDLPNL